MKRQLSRAELSAAYDRRLYKWTSITALRDMALHIGDFQSAARLQRRIDAIERQFRRIFARVEWQKLTRAVAS